MKESFSNGAFGMMLSIIHRGYRAPERPLSFRENEKGMRRKWCGVKTETVWAIGVVGMPLRICGRGLAAGRAWSGASRLQLFCFEI